MARITSLMQLADNYAGKVVKVQYLPDPTWHYMLVSSGTIHYGDKERKIYVKPEVGDKDGISELYELTFIQPRFVMETTTPSEVRGKKFK